MFSKEKTKNIKAKGIKRKANGVPLYQPKSVLIISPGTEESKRTPMSPTNLSLVILSEIK